MYLLNKKKTKTKQSKGEMKYLSLFSGIGAYEKALKRLNKPYELIGYAEIDKHASKSYSIIHDTNESKNLGSVVNIKESDLSNDIDLFTYSFPCQDLSSSGKQKGMFNEDGSLTRSGLFFEGLRLIKHTRPKVAIAENVKNLASKKFANELKLILESLDSIGYNNYYQIMNSKDYGIPQNRDRIFIVSIRKDVDNGKFSFPDKIPLKKVLKDIILPHEDIDERFYLSKEETERIINSWNEKFLNNMVKEDTPDRCIQIGQMYGLKNNSNPQAGRIYSANGISPTVDTCCGGNRMPKIVLYKDIKEGTFVERHYKSFIAKNNYIPELFNPYNEIELDTLAPTQLTTCNLSTSSSSVIIKHFKNKGDEIYKFRRLTPLECWRLMGFDDEDYHKIKDVIPMTNQYKQAGNSVVVNCLEHIFLKIFQTGIL